MRRNSQAKNYKKAFTSRFVFALFVAILMSTYFGLASLLLGSSPDPLTIQNYQQELLIKNNNYNDVNYKKPRLERYIQGWNITGNVSWLLDFAIVGFPKTGTSTLMLYLENQTESVFIFPQERCEMGWNQHVPLLVDLYKHYQPNLRLGIKCPRDLEIDLALQNYRRFFPTTKFMVGLRHPILWFQSFYNFRITNDFEMPPPERLIGKCGRSNQGVCTYRANFSKHLEKIEPWRKVFLYNVAQLEDPDPVRSRQFRTDLTNFLDLKSPLHDPMIWVKPGQKPLSMEHAKELESKKMNICDGKYFNLRRVLCKQASHSAKWIQEVFLANPNVRISSPNHFVTLLDSWHHDPCNLTVTIR